MKITFLLNRDIASNYAINRLLPYLSNHEITIFLSSKVGGNSNKAEALQRLQFFEQGLFNQLIFPMMQKGNQTDGYKSFEQISEEISSPITELNQINSDAGLLAIGASEPDLIISIRYGVILKEQVLAIPKYGVINLHSGLLPNYRGVMATFWALLNHESTIGTTLHFISDSKIDAGKIIATATLPVDKTKSYLWHVLELYKGGCSLITDHLQQLANQQQINAFAQVAEGNYYTFPKEMELNRFKENGLKLYDEQELITFVHQHYLNNITDKQARA